VLRIWCLNTIWQPFNVWTETPHGGTVNFITGAGGFLQSTVFGTSGLRIASSLAGGLTFSPPPPMATGTAATRISLGSFYFRGSRLRQDVTENSTTYTLLSSSVNAPQLSISSENGLNEVMEVGKPVRLERITVRIRAL